MSLAANAEFASLSRRHPANARFKRDEWLSLHNAGEAKMFHAYAWDDLARLLERDESTDAAKSSGRLLNEALELFERGLSIAESLWNSDEANLEGHRDLAIMLNKVGTVLIDLKSWERSRTYLDRSVAVREETFKTDATHMHRRDLAQAILKRGLLDVERVKANAVAEPDREAVIRAAISQFERGMEHLTVLRNAGVMSEKDSDVVNATRQIEGCRRLLDPAEAGTSN
jgi:hypothetical protein